MQSEIETAVLELLSDNTDSDDIERVDEVAALAS